MDQVIINQVNEAFNKIKQLSKHLPERALKSAKFVIACKVLEYIVNEKPAGLNADGLTALLEGKSFVEDSPAFAHCNITLRRSLAENMDIIIKNLEYRPSKPLDRLIKLSEPQNGPKS